MRSERRIEELESGVGRLRNQQESLRKKLKQQAEKKIKLEASLGLLDCEEHMIVHDIT